VNFIIYGVIIVIKNIFVINDTFWRQKEMELGTKLIN